MDKQEIIDGIIEREGGYVFNKNDSGKETKYGITQAVAFEQGYTDDMKDFPRELAFKIYENEYWNSVKADDLNVISSELAEEVVDTGINMGVRTASKFLQRCLNAFNNRGKIYPDITIDGWIGPKTLYSLRRFYQYRGKEGIVVLVRALDTLQGARYIKLAERREKDEEFVYGWMRNRTG